MKLKNIFFIISFVSIFNITYAGWFDGEKNEEIFTRKKIVKKKNSTDDLIYIYHQYLILKFLKIF